MRAGLRETRAVLSIPKILLKVQIVFFSISNLARVRYRDRLARGRRSMHVLLPISTIPRSVPKAIKPFAAESTKYRPRLSNFLACFRLGAERQTDRQHDSHESDETDSAGKPRVQLKTARVDSQTCSALEIAWIMKYRLPRG
jgi:hypothetical protein